MAAAMASNSHCCTCMLVKLFRIIFGNIEEAVGRKTLKGKKHFQNQRLVLGSLLITWPASKHWLCYSLDCMILHGCRKYFLNKQDRCCFLKCIIIIKQNTNIWKLDSPWKSSLSSFRVKRTNVFSTLSDSILYILYLLFIAAKLCFYLYGCIIPSNGNVQICHFGTFGISAGIKNE